MVMLKRSHKNRFLPFVIFPLFFLFSGNSIQSNDNIDITQFLPQGCKPGVFNCGLLPDSQEAIDAVPLAEPLAARAYLPSSVDLSSKMPPPGSQGRQGSCVGWASTYALHAYHEKVKNRWSYGRLPQSGGRGDHYFSPAWTYNQINYGVDRGSSWLNALRLLRDKGAAPWSYMPYNYRDYRTQPSYSTRQIALKYRIKRYFRLNLSNPKSIKAQIAKGNPVATAVWVYSKSFGGRQVMDHIAGRRLGGHAIVIVGYDDHKRSPRGHIGAWKIQNSYGQRWGINGFGWISYRHFMQIGKYAYGVESSAGYKTTDQPISYKITAPQRVYASHGNYNNRVIVQWDSVQNAKSYAIQRQVSGQAFRHLAYSHGSSYGDYAVRPNQTFRYRIISIGARSRSNAADSPVAEGYASTNNNSLPGQISSIRKKLMKRGRYLVWLSWQPTSNSTGYEIQKYNYSRNYWQRMSRGSSLFVKDLQPQTGINQYRIRAYNRYGFGPFSHTISVRLSSDNSGDVPGVVSGVRASQGSYNSKIEIEWTPISNAEKYLVYRYNSSARKWDRHFYITRNRTVDTRNLEEGIKYYYTILAYNRSGRSRKWSSYAMGYTGYGSEPWAARSGKVNPPQKLNMKIDNMNKRVILDWSRVRGARGYNIYRKEGGTDSYIKLGTVKSKSSEFKDDLSNQENKLFFYKVRSLSALYTESTDSDIAIGFINGPTYAPRTIFIPGQGLKNFIGRWHATYWDIKNKPLDFVLQIGRIGRDEFVVQTIFRGKKHRVKGKYASGSRYLTTKNFEFQLIEEFKNDVAHVVFQSGIIAKNKIVLDFVRQGSQ